MDMANLPAIVDSSSISETEERFQDQIVALLSQGLSARNIATRAYPHDRNKRRKLEHRIFKLTAYDQNFQAKLAVASKVQLMQDLPATTRAVGQRAKRGRMDAARVLMEATGFHNTKVKHEHSGEIKVKLEMPRPQFDAEVSDAEVVE